MCDRAYGKRHPGGTKILTNLIHKMPRNHDCTASFRSPHPSLYTHCLLEVCPETLASSPRSSSHTKHASLSSHSSHSHSSHSSNPLNALSPSILSLALLLCVDVSIVGTVWCDQDRLRLLRGRCSLACWSLCGVGVARSLCGWSLSLFVSLALSRSPLSRSLFLSLPFSVVVC